MSTRAAVSKYRRVVQGLVRRRPIFAILRPTGDCNLKCTYCRVPAANRVPTLDLDTLREVARRLRRLGVAILNIGGGEPFLRPDLEGIVAEMCRHFSVRMQTNGMLAHPERVRAIARTGLSGLSISLDTLDAARFDRVRGGAGAWEGAVRAMVRFGREMPRRGPLMIMNVVVTRHNAGELPALTRFANALGYYPAFVPVLSASDAHAGAESSFRTYVPGFLPDGAAEATLERAYDDLIALKRGGAGLANSYRFLRDSRDYVRRQHRGWTCEAGAMYLVVAPDGRFSICSEYHPIASLLDDDVFAALLRGDFAGQFQDMVDHCADCMHPCFAEISLLRNDAFVLAEKGLTDLSLQLRRRRATPTYSDALRLAEDLRGVGGSGG